MKYIGTVRAHFILYILPKEKGLKHKIANVFKYFQHNPIIA